MGGDDTGTRTRPDRPITRSQHALLEVANLALARLHHGEHRLVQLAVELAEADRVGILVVDRRRRNEETFEPEQYAQKLPANLSGRDVFVLDPMLATGGSLAFACQLLLDKGAERITAVSVISAPEGVNRVREACPTVRIVTAALDPGLNDKAFIVPGLGDAGDRLFGQSTSA